MKKALIIGIDHYNETINNLHHSVTTAIIIEKLLSRNETTEHPEGTPNFDCKLLISTADKTKLQITRATIKENCKLLFEDEETDIAVLYFSGYRFEDSLGGYLVSQDAERYDEGVSFNDIMIYANNSLIKEISIILDGHYISEQKPNENDHYALLRKGISILSAKTFHNNCSETNLFAELIINTLNGGNADILGKVTLIELYEQTDLILNGLEYEVTLQSNTSRLGVLRETKPKIPYSTLVKIKTFFPESTYYFPLDKEHIPSQKLGKMEKQGDYKQLQKMVKQGLVKPINAIHLYYAALNQKHCALTQYGQQYWELLDKNRI